MAKRKCLRCDVIETLTEDHVIPQWFKKQLPNFGVKIDKFENEVELVCQKCNTTKGGKIDFSFKCVREVMKLLIIDFVAQIRKYEEFNP